MDWCFAHQTKLDLFIFHSSPIFNCIDILLLHPWIWTFAFLFLLQIIELRQWSLFDWSYIIALLNIPHTCFSQTCSSPQHIFKSHYFLLVLGSRSFNLLAALVRWWQIQLVLIYSWSEHSYVSLNIFSVLIGCLLFLVLIIRLCLFLVLIKSFLVKPICYNIATHLLKQLHW